VTKVIVVVDGIRGNRGRRQRGSADQGPANRLTVRLQKSNGVIWQNDGACQHRTTGKHNHDYDDLDAVRVEHIQSRFVWRAGLIAAREESTVTIAGPSFMPRESVGCQEDDVAPFREFDTVLVMRAQKSIRVVIGFLATSEASTRQKGDPLNRVQIAYRDTGPSKQPRFLRNGVAAARRVAVWKRADCDAPVYGRYKELGSSRAANPLGATE
jgi:hypothetical protein